MMSREEFHCAGQGGSMVPHAIETLLDMLLAEQRDTYVRFEDKERPLWFDLLLEGLADDGCIEGVVFPTGEAVYVLTPRGMTIAHGVHQLICPVCSQDMAKA